MIELRPFNSLGRFRAGWLDAHYHFSFADYYDPTRMGIGALRVWNDDTIAPGSGFPPHPHRDMEIISYIREGAISHADGLGNKGRTGAGDVQVMSAGTGIVHSEYNLEEDETRMFQIWIQPAEIRVQPRWETRDFPREEGRLVALASGRDQHPDALRIHQDAAVLGATLGAGQSIDYPLIGRQAYVVPARGRLRVNGVEARARDGILVGGVDRLAVEAIEDAELVVADLAA